MPRGDLFPGVELQAVFYAGFSNLYSQQACLLQCLQSAEEARANQLSAFSRRTQRPLPPLCKLQRLASHITHTEEWFYFFPELFVSFLCIGGQLVFSAFPLGFPEQGEVHKADDGHPEAEVWGRHTKHCGGAGEATRSGAQNGPLGHEHCLEQCVWDR